MIKLVNMLLDILAPSRVEVRSLKARNDLLVQQNNRLGKRILELSDCNSRGRKRGNGNNERQIVQAETKYKTHVESQRQKIVVQQLRQLVSAEQFESICNMANNLTDEQVLAQAKPAKRPKRPK